MAKKQKSSPGPYLLELELLRDRIANPIQFPYNLPALRDFQSLRFHPQVTFFVGENGSGKSTLLEAIAVSCDLNAEGGSRHFNFATRASHSNLDDCLRLARSLNLPGDSFFLRAESFYNVASEIENLGSDLLGAYGGRSLHHQSHGESFFALFENRFRQHGLYLLDEPEAALSPKRQVQFLSLLHDYLKIGGQFVIATHSPIIMAYPNATIYHFDSEGIRQITYKETEHYLITRGFLSNPQGVFDLIFAENDNKES